MPVSEDAADVLIIGSGASGAAFAWRLSKVPGIRVVCLEQGDWVQPAYNPTADTDNEYLKLISPPPTDGVNRFADGYPYDYTQSIWQPGMYHGVGGGTIHYEGGLTRCRPSDFRVRTITGAADDWPISYWDLEPYYDLNERMMGVSGLAGNPGGPPRSAMPLPPAKIGRGPQIFIKGFEKLGWHWWISTRGIVTEPYGEGRLPCDYQCSSCGLGCHRKAKASVDIVYWPEAVRNGVEVKTRSTVREVTVNKQGLAEGALYYDEEGRLHEQKARLVVVACNGVGTPRLLLNSKSPQFPDGLANSSGLVGKNLMSHVIGYTVGLSEEVDSFDDGLRAGGVFTEQFYEHDSARGFVNGFRLSAGYGSAGPLETAMGCPSVSMGLGNGRSPIWNAAPWGEGHHAAFRKYFRHTLGVMMSGDDLPEEANRVVIDPALTDDAGIPAPKLVYRRGENGEKLLDHAAERAKELLDASGSTEIVSVSRGGGAIGHYLGTARMGDDPSTSVVDGWCRSHDVRNLFIIDGSVFVTSGTVAPTSTIGAIALRAGDYVVNNARHLLELEGGAVGR